MTGANDTTASLSLFTVPPEVRYFAGCFIAGSDEWFTEADEWIAFAVHFSKPPQQAVIKKFIERLFADGLDDAALARAWLSCGPGYLFAPESVRAFLTRVKDAIPVSPDRKFTPRYPRGGPAD